MQLFLLCLTILVFWLTNVANFKITEVRGVSLVNLNTYLLMVVWAFMAMKRRRLVQPNNLNAWIAVLILIACLSVFVKIYMGELPNLNLKNELFNIKNWANPFLIFLILFNVIDDSRVSKIGMGILLCFLAITLLPMLFHALGIMRLGMLADPRIQTGRSAGFAEANQYATFLVLMAPLCLSYFLAQSRGLVKLSMLGLFALVVLGLFVTGSRGGIVSFCVALGVYALLLYRHDLISLQPILLGGLALLMVAVISYSVIPSHSQKVMTKRFNPENYKGMDDFSNGRMVFWRGGLQLFLESPIVGHGHGSYIDLMEKVFRLKTNSHNDYLSYLVHYGILGLTVFVVLLFNILRHMTRSLAAARSTEEKALCAAYLSGFLGYAASMMFVNIITPAFIFWVYTALIYKWTLLELDAPALEDELDTASFEARPVYR